MHSTCPLYQYKLALLKNIGIMACLEMLVKTDAFTNICDSHVNSFGYRYTNTFSYPLSELQKMI